MITWRTAFRWLKATVVLTTEVVYSTMTSSNSPYCFSSFISFCLSISSSRSRILLSIPPSIALRYVSNITSAVIGFRVFSSAVAAGDAASDDAAADAAGAAGRSAVSAAEELIMRRLPKDLLDGAEVDSVAATPGLESVDG